LSTGKNVTARAGVNIALVKYWGKASVQENLPAVGSISMTLRELFTQTRISASTDGTDRFELNTKQSNDPRVFHLLDLLRMRAGVNEPVHVVSQNFVPTASGLASSASGSAALVTAAWHFFTGNEDWNEVIDVVRKGSGSAPRSLLGGLVELDKATGGIEQLCAPEDWPLSMVVAQLSEGSKSTSSRQGMSHTKATSIYYDAWVTQHPSDLAHARQAIASKDLERLGTVMESSTMRMHACMLGACPPLLYWNSNTIKIIELVTQLRQQGIGAWYTMDAGPHVKILCQPTDAQRICEAVKSSGVSLKTTMDSMGAGVCLL
jgi:diphosphomevalonate decarboxylase